MLKLLKLSRLLTLAMTGSMLLASTAFADALTGNPAPAFTAQTAEGESVSLSDYAGKTVVLEWTNHGCPFVKRHYKGNMQAQQTAALDEGVIWLQVVSSAPGRQGHVDGETAIELNEKRKALVTTTLLDEDGTIGRAYGARTTPHMFVIDGAGILQYAGGIDDKPRGGQGATQFVPAALAALTAGQTPNPAETRPYGCSIKYDG